VLHPSSEPIADSERKARLDCARKSIKELLPLAKEIGAVLCIENLPRTCLGRVTDELKYILEPFPELMVCFDTNHLLIESHEKFFYELGDRIGTIHISDYDRIDERHDLPGNGVIDWPAFHYMLRQCGYDGIFMY
jgi:sugar phosphate isomerase/epimerase